MHIFSFIARIGALWVLAIWTNSCANTTGGDIRLPTAPRETAFDAVSDSPLDDYKGRHSDIREVDRFSIGFGSGQYGFHSITLSGDCVLRVVWKGDGLDYYFAASTILSADSKKRLLSNGSILDCARLSRHYSGDVSDGVQGFVAAGSEGYFNFTYCNNVFPEPYRESWDLLGAYVISLPGSVWTAPIRENGHKAYFEAKSQLTNQRGSSSGKLPTESDALRELRGTPATFLNFEDGKLVSVDAHQRFDDYSLSLLSSFDTIEAISLLDSPISGKGLAKMGNQNTLKRLGLGSGTIKDEDLVALLDYPHLERLDLNLTKVTDDCIETILSMESLREVGLLSSKISDSGIETLKNNRPDLVIY